MSVTIVKFKKYPNPLLPISGDGEGARSRSGGSEDLGTWGMRAENPHLMQ